MVYSHCLTPGPGPRPGPGPGRMACMVLIRAFHIAPGQGQGPGKQMGAIPIFQVLKMFPVLKDHRIIMFFPVPVPVQCERLLSKPYKPFFPVPVPVPVQCERFCIIPVPVPVSVSVPKSDSVNTP